MKSSKSKYLAIAVIMLMTSGTANATLLVIGGPDYYLGSGSGGTPADCDSRAARVNGKIAPPATVNCDTNNVTYESGGNGNQNNALGYDYVYARYKTGSDGSWHVWDISSIGDSIMLPDSDLNGNKSDHWSAFNAQSDTATVPEPGTLTLLGLGLIGLAIGRRRA